MHIALSNKRKRWENLRRSAAVVLRALQFLHRELHSIQRCRDARACDAVSHPRRKGGDNSAADDRTPHDGHCPCSSTGDIEQGRDHLIARFRLYDSAAHRSLGTRSRPRRWCVHPVLPGLRTVGPRLSLMQRSSMLSAHSGMPAKLAKLSTLMYALSSYRLYTCHLRKLSRSDIGS